MKDKTEETGGKQTKLLPDEIVDIKEEIDEICMLINNNDVRLCARSILLLAEKKKNRKCSKAELLHLIVKATGKHRRSTLESIFKRIRTYDIFYGCELGRSVVIRQPSEIRIFLLE